MCGCCSEGHVHVLEYLRTNGCPWDSDACALLPEEINWIR